MMTAGRVAVLGAAANETNVELVAAWRSYGLNCVLVDAPDAWPFFYDIVLGRLDVLPTLDGVEPGLLELFWLERRGVAVLNRASALLAAHDKLRTAVALERAHLPHPLTRHVPPHEIAALPQAPVVLKPRFGSWGRDVRLCRSDSEVVAAMGEFGSRRWFRRHGVLAQEVVPTAGFDLRLLLAGGRVVGALERHPQPGEWRTNISVGASTRPATPDAAACRLAVAAADAIGADLVGVDLMPLPGGGYAVIELNAAVEFTPEYCGGRDVYRLVADALDLTRDPLHDEPAEVHGGDQSHHQSALCVLRTDNSTRVRDGYNRLSTRGHARPRET